jgi:hypothetical protein
MLAAARLIQVSTQAESQSTKITQGHIATELQGEHGGLIIFSGSGNFKLLQSHIRKIALYDIIYDIISH